MKNLVKNEANFAKALARALSPELSDEEKRIIDVRYGLDHGGIVNFANSYLKRLAKAIRKEHMSLEGFEVSNAEAFSDLLDSEKLDKKLQEDLSHLLYGADERAQYFHWDFLQVCLEI